jgi:hypothetical protein
MGGDDLRAGAADHSCLQPVERHRNRCCGKTSPGNRQLRACGNGAADGHTEEWVGEPWELPYILVKITKRIASASGIT